MRVIGDAQVIVAVTIQVDPALDCLTYARTDGHGERGGTVRWYGYARRHRDPVVGRAQSSGVVDERHGSSEIIRSKLRRRDAERLIGAGGVVQCDVNRCRSTNGLRGRSLPKPDPSTLLRPRLRRGSHALHLVLSGRRRATLSPHP